MNTPAVSTAAKTTICDPADEHITIGDQVQWECNGQLMFIEPRQVIAVSEDYEYVYVDGSLKPLPIEEVTAVAPAQTPVGTAPRIRQDTFCLEEGEVLRRYPAHLSSQSFDDITDWLILEHRKMSRFVDGDGTPTLMRITAKEISDRQGDLAVYPTLSGASLDLGADKGVKSPTHRTPSQRAETAPPLRTP